MAGSLQFHKRYVEFLALAMLLHPVGKAEGIIQFAALKHVEPSAEYDFPTMVSGDVAVVLGAGGIEGPRKLDADAGAGIGHLLKVLGLALAIEFVFDGDNMDGHFIVRTSKSADCFQ